MTTLDVDHLAQSLSAYVDYELTNILYNEKALQLSFSKDKDYTWLCASLKPGVPFAFLGGKRVPLIKNLKKPLSLFANTHLKGACLSGVCRLSEKGRVLQIRFGDDGEKSLEIGLFTGGQNIQVISGRKSVTALKPKDLPPLVNDDTVTRPLLEPEVFIKEWESRHGSFKNQNKDAKALEAKSVAQQLKKKRQGLEKMERKLEEGRASHWARAGEWAKAHPQLENLPEDFADVIDVKESSAWNIENCFAQMKKLEAKKQGTLQRIETLKQEILKLESGTSLDKKGSAGKSLMQVADAKGQTFPLANGWRLFVGKSAKDNLSLLRRAKAWYIWMHIRDFPGAYGIIERPRKATDPDISILEAAAVQVAKRSVKGDKSGAFEVLFAECRYVRPIPKAKTGQVTYSHEKVIRVRL